jgi:rhodanese-related sulfurtransferase
VLVVVAYFGLTAALFYYFAVRIDRARALLLRGGLLVDVDRAPEFARHHPSIAVSIPLEDLEVRSAELGASNRPLVVFAHSWLRGARAAHILRAIGFAEVLNLASVRTRETSSERALRRRS